MKKIIIANWKMQLSIKDSIKLALELTKQNKFSEREVVVCPDFLSLPLIKPIFAKSFINLGAQDLAMTEQGAYTGEVSALDLKTLGVQYVIIGHSERRLHLGETAMMINEKIKIALKNKLTPILCIGENLQEKEAGKTKKILVDELKQALKNIKIRNAKDIIIAYEPLWAIGSGHAIVPVEAEIMHSVIKKEAKKILGKTVTVIYGGSVNQQNSSLFLNQKNVDGLLVGGASLNASEFIKICQN
jgi:triosephosphate isomerase